MERFELYDSIDERLEDMDGAACVSRFYSDYANVVVMCDPHIKNDVIEVMSDFDHYLYDAGGNASSLMLTFKHN